LTKQGTRRGGPQEPIMILDDIVRRKRQEVAVLPAVDPRRLVPSRRDFGRALKTAASRVAIIAEIKQASPSAGRLTADFDPVRIAREYEAGGAAAISVLTDVDFFQGSIDHLAAVAAAVEIPVLRKDFIIDERQIHEARAAGADSLLLIAAILDGETLRGFIAEARSLRMEPLVEIHDAAEAEKALAAGARIVGINNRDLRDFRIAVDTTLALAPGLPRHVTRISESGIESEAMLARLDGVVDAALIGTALMKSDDREALLRRLAAATAGPAAGQEKAREL
jgi:indole-3-glycerol phosphate synthase